MSPSKSYGKSLLGRLGLLRLGLLRPCLHAELERFRLPLSSLSLSAYPMCPAAGTLTGWISMVGITGALALDNWDYTTEQNI